MILRQAYIELKEHQTKKRIEKAQQNRDSWAISDDDYEYQYEAIMDDYRLSILSLLPL